MRWPHWMVLTGSLLSTTPLVFGAVTLTGSAVRLVVEGSGAAKTATFLIQDGTAWVPALTAGSAVYVRTDTGMQVCSLEEAQAIERGLLLTGDCGVGKFEQRVTLTDERDVLDVATRLMVKDGAVVHSVEDRWDFVPAKHMTQDAHTGPLDFVWSQNIKSEADDLIPTNCFKSPVVMMQQGQVFAALMPRLSDHHVEVRALDLDVTSGQKPWMAYGAIPSEPHGHSYFRRAVNQTLQPIANIVEYRYSILLSAQPARLGYQRAVRLLWERFGHPELLRSGDEQQNVLRPELRSFASWRQQAWRTYADRIYTSFDCDGRLCGTLASDRNYLGDWQHPEPDAWFNAWFETLRTAYGWYLHGRAIHDVDMMRKAESILNLALTSPRKGGAFSTIYLVNERTWKPGDGWAGYADSYHAFSMSWTAYWMLRWAEDLTPDRKTEILQFVKPYGDFLLANQLSSGVIPSWYYADSLKPRAELRDFNAETGPSALFLATLGAVTGDARYTQAAEKAMDFVVREVLPRQRWFDFETFLSCARKPYSFYDKWTAQYPQNNLAEIEAVRAMLVLYESTHKREYLERGTQMLDYLLLTQQVWNNPMFTPELLGGFTTQNTDAEWSDARQGYGATLLAQYYRVTGNVEYLERAVAAARSTFAVAPWENWAHTGYPDVPGALTGFHWGTGSAMTSVEMLQPMLGDALIDAKAEHGVGFDDCTVTDATVRGDTISFHITSFARQREFLVRFRGLEAGQTYQVSWNGGSVKAIAGTQLMKDGLKIPSLDTSLVEERK